jgi:hypothetical protein
VEISGVDLSCAARGHGPESPEIFDSSTTHFIFVAMEGCTPDWRRPNVYIGGMYYSKIMSFMILNRGNDFKTILVWVRATDPWVKACPVKSVPHPEGKTLLPPRTC